MVTMIAAIYDMLRKFQALGGDDKTNSLGSLVSKHKDNI